ncbi:MAG: hypothetical protein K0M55_15810 [Rhizobium sp.]|nr:hypothetical protein [Rhizobium sp.]MBW8319263.1 hypothetical protein [Rhizobium sp.]
MFSRSAKTTDRPSVPLEVPSLTNASPRYAALVERKLQLKARLDELEKLRNEEYTRASLTKKDRQDRVDQLVDPDYQIGDAIASVQPDNKSRVQAIVDEIGAIKLALDEIENQINRERLIASHIICETFAPEHRRRVRVVVSAMASLLEACAEYRQFMDAMNNEDIAWSNLGPMYPFWFSDRVNSFFDEAARHGFITSDEIPEIRR